MKTCLKLVFRAARHRGEKKTYKIQVIINLPTIVKVELCTTSILIWISLIVFLIMKGALPDRTMNVHVCPWHFARGDDKDNIYMSHVYGPYRLNSTSCTTVAMS